MSRSGRTDLEQVVVAVDPAGSPRTGTVGIIVVGRRGAEAYVLEDASCRADADVWPEQIGLAAIRHDADTIIAEDNFGGDMVRRLLADVGLPLPVRLVTSTSSKPLRAQRTGTMYAKGRVFHVGRPADYRHLVQQLTMWVPRPAATSPDRLDALVHGVNHFFFSTGGRMSLGCMNSSGSCRYDGLCRYSATVRGASRLGGDLPALR